MATQHAISRQSFEGNLAYKAQQIKKNPLKIAWDLFGAGAKNLNSSLNSKLSCSPKSEGITRTDELPLTNTSNEKITEIVSLITTLVQQKKFETLVKIYNLIMLVDESTKARYQGQENVTIFQKNLPNTIQALLKNALSKDKAEQLAHEFMTIGKHSSESWDEYIADKLSLKFNTSRVKKVKAFIKSHIPQTKK